MIFPLMNSSRRSGGRIQSGIANTVNWHSPCQIGSDIKQSVNLQTRMNPAHQREKRETPPPAPPAPLAPAQRRNQHNNQPGRKDHPKKDQRPEPQVRNSERELQLKKILLSPLPPPLKLNQWPPLGLTQGTHPQHLM